MSDSDLPQAISTLSRREEGQTMAEYGVVLAVITVASVAVFTALGDGVEGALKKVISLLPV
ncbi:MAG: Flp family type IVb pilin [Actinobacteria bacterium]|jgi:Flp pilus assembly pilin Flp|nr:Flp family type IVb pilin [Actinomycetota bacterium]